MFLPIWNTMKEVFHENPVEYLTWNLMESPWKTSYVLAHMEFHNGLYGSIIKTTSSSAIADEPHDVLLHGKGQNFKSHVTITTPIWRVICHLFGSIRYRLPV